MSPDVRRVKRVLRMFQIVRLLQERPFTTDELAERFGVSTRTIRRDLLELQLEPVFAPLVCKVRCEWHMTEKWPDVGQILSDA